MAKDGFRVVYPVEAFDGGLNNKYDRNIIADNESPDCLNVEFSDRGGVQTRGGMSQLNTASVGSYAGDGLFTARYNDGTEKMLGWWNGTMYQLGTTTFVTVGSAQSVWTAGSRVDMAMYQNLAFFGNGHSQPYKYNGTEFTRHGVTQPNSTGAQTSGTAGTSGPAGGDVNYVFTYRNSYLVESDFSSSTATLAIGSTATVSIACIPVAPTSFGVAARRIYRRSAGSGGSYKLVATLSDNTTTTYVDQVTDASLGAAAPTDNGEPPEWQYVVSHQERLWMVGPDAPQTLYYSELGNPFVVESTNFILISDGDGEAITGLGVHANMVVVYKEASVWLIYLPDTDPTNWVRIKSNSKYGGVSHYAQADYNGLKLFLGKRYSQLQGFLELQGADIKPNSTDLLASAVLSESASDRIEPDVFLFTSNSVSKACAIEYRNKLWFAVPYNGSTSNNRVYQFDYLRRANSNANGAWAPFTYPYSIAAFTIYGGSLYAQAGTANGFVYRLNTDTYSDNGTAIDSYLWTKEFFGHKQHMENWKNFRFSNWILEMLGTYYMNVSYRTDGDRGPGTTQQVYLDPGGTIWGSFTWGAATWGGGQSQKKVTVNLATTSGKRIQFKFSNQNALNQGFHVYPLGSFTYNLRGKR